MGAIYSRMATHHTRKKVFRMHPTDRPGPWLKRLRLSHEIVFTMIVGILALNVAYFGYFKDTPPRVSHFFSPSVDWNQRRVSVRDSFVESWEGYFRDAWGNDRYHPVSHMGSQMSPSGLGWIIIDSLDSLMLMNLTSELAECRKWLHRSLTWDQDQDVNTFETTIRMLGGLLSAHYLSQQLPESSSRRDHIYLQKARDLGDRLLSAYTSRSGLPYASVNLGKQAGLPSHADRGASLMAEASTVQLEMKYLSYLTGDESYWRKSEAVLKVLDDNAAQDGLLPILFIQTQADSLRERYVLGVGETQYLIKQHLQTSETIYLEMWDEAFRGIQKHLLVSTQNSGLKVVAELPQGIGGEVLPKMDHLVCFLPGTIALAATGGLTLGKARRNDNWSAEKEEQMTLARELLKTCWGMYAVTETGLAPEIAFFNIARAGDGRSGKSSDRLYSWKKDYIIKPLDAHNLQRPETVESLFMMWRITEDPIYRDWGWKIFQAFKKHTSVGEGQGYTSVNNVNAVPPGWRDNMESFWLAETLKYLYLLFSPTDFFPLEDIVFNTEAHIFPRFHEDKWGTGWRRKSAAS